MRNPKAMKSIYAAALLIGFMLSATLVVGLFTRANGNPCSDGRINCDGAQTGAVYCSASGVQVLYSGDNNPRQGQQALYVSAGQIDSTGIPGGSHAQLASDGNGYTLHRLTDGRLQFTAPGLQAGTLYEFRFPWPGCREGVVPSAVEQPDTAVNPATPPTATPIPPPVQIIVNVNCNVPGQYQISMTGDVTTSVTYSLDTNPSSSPLIGALNGTSDSATAAYGAGGLYNITGNYSINGGLPVTVNITNCPG